jgi:hypothetical protein
MAVYNDAEGWLFGKKMTRKNPLAQSRGSGLIEQG